METVETENAKDVTTTRSAAAGRPTWLQLMSLLMGRPATDEDAWPAFRLRITPGAAIQVWTPEREDPFGRVSEVASGLLNTTVRGNAVVLTNDARVFAPDMLKPGDEARGELASTGPVWRSLKPRSRRFA